MTATLQSVKATYRSSDARYLLWTATGNERKELIDLIIAQNDPEPLIAISNPHEILATLILSISKSSYRCSSALADIYRQRLPEEIMTIAPPPSRSLDRLSDAIVDNNVEAIISSLTNALKQAKQPTLTRLRLPESHREAILGLIATALVEKDFDRYALICELFHLDRYVLGVDMLPYCIRNGKNWLEIYLNNRLDIAQPILVNSRKEVKISPLLYAARDYGCFELLLPRYEADPISLQLLTRAVGGKREINNLIFEHYNLNSLSGLAYCLCALVASIPYYAISGPPSLVYPLKE